MIFLEELFRIRLRFEPISVLRERWPYRAQGIEERQPSHSMWPIDSHLEGDDAAPIVPHYGGAFDSERVHEIDHVLREHPTRYSRSRFIGLSEAAHIGSEHRVMLGKRAELMPPAIRGLGKSVKQDDGFAGSALHVMHADIRRLDELSGCHQVQYRDPSSLSI